MEPTGTDFERLYQTYADFVYGIALSYLRNPQEAEDATADIFVQLLEHPVEFEDDSHARRWLTVTTANRCKNLLKAWQRRKRLTAEALESMTVSAPDAVLREVMAALLNLPERYRMPLLLTAVYGYSTAEAADMLHIGESTIRTRISRARQIIRKETGVNDA